MRKLGREGLAFSGDATTAAHMDQLARDVLGQFGHLDVLVNCLGDAISKPVLPCPAGAPPE